MADAKIDAARLAAAQQYVQAEAGPRRRLHGAVSLLVAAIAVAMSLLFLYWAWATVAAQILRLAFLGISLVLSFLVYPLSRAGRDQSIPWYDWLLAAASIGVVAYPLWDFEEFIYRAALIRRWPARADSSRMHNAAPWASLPLDGAADGADSRSPAAASSAA